MRCLPPPLGGTSHLFYNSSHPTGAGALKLLVWDAREPGGGDSSPSS